MLPERGLSVKDAAEQLGVSSVTFSRVINGRSAISAEMSLRLGQRLGNGPEIWLRMQVAYDLWHAKRGLKKLKIKLAVSATHSA